MTWWEAERCAGRSTCMACLWLSPANCLVNSASVAAIICTTAGDAQKCARSTAARYGRAAVQPTILSCFFRIFPNATVFSELHNEHKSQSKGEGALGHTLCPDFVSDNRSDDGLDTAGEVGNVVLPLGFDSE